MKNLARNPSLIIGAALVILLASLAARRGFATAIACVAVVQLGLVHVRNEQKPLTGPHRITLGLTQSDALLTTFRPDYAQVTRNLSRLVPAAACLGAAVGPDDPSFLLFGARFDRRVTFLPHQRAAAAATARGLRLVVLGRASGAAGFAARGWLLRPLSRGDHPPWTLAVARAGAPRGCP